MSTQYRITTASSVQSEAPDSQNNRVITAAFGRHTKETNWTRNVRSLPFDQFVDEYLSLPKLGSKDGPCYIQGTLQDGKQSRVRQNVARLDIIVLDINSGHTIDELADAALKAGYRAAIHSTYSHMTDTNEVSVENFDRWADVAGRNPGQYLQQHKGMLPYVVEGAEIIGKTADGKSYIIRHQPCPKFRVLMPLAKPWSTSDYPDFYKAAEVWREALYSLAAHLGLRIDESCVDPSRLYYLPRVPDEAAFEHRQFANPDGTPCDPWSLPKAAPKKANRVRPVAGAWRPRAEPGDHQAPPPWAPDLAQAKDEKGETVDLIAWEMAQRLRFEAVKAIRARNGDAVFGRISGPKHHPICPFDKYHTTEKDPTGFFLVNASQIGEAQLGVIDKGFYAKCSHSSCAGLRPAHYIAGLLADGRLMVDDLDNKRFLITAERDAMEPEQPAPTLSVEEGREIGRDAAEQFAQKVIDWNYENDLRRAGYESNLLAERKALRDERREMKKAGILLEKLPPLRRDCPDIDPAPSTFWQWEVAVGKTQASIQALTPLAVDASAPPLRRDRKAMVFAVPQHKLSAEFAQRIQAAAAARGLDITTAIYRGREQVDPEAETLGDKMCPIRAELGPALSQALYDQDDSCETKGGYKCPRFNSCGYQRQKKKRVDAWVIPHALLPHQKPAQIDKPLALVVDENCRGSLLTGFGATPSQVDIDDIGSQSRIIFHNGEINDDATADLAEIMAKIAKVFSDAVDEDMRKRIPVQHFIDAGVDLTKAKYAKGLLYQTKAEMTFKASDDNEVIAKAAKEAKDANGSLPHVIRAVKILIWHLERQEPLLRGIEIERRTDKMTGKVLEAVRLRQFTPIDETWGNAPRLAMDATGVIENIAPIFAPISSNDRVAIQVKVENAYIRQIPWSASQSTWDFIGKKDESSQVTDEQKAEEARHIANIDRILDHVTAHAHKYLGTGAKVEMPDRHADLAVAELARVTDEREKAEKAGIVITELSRKERRRKGYDLRQVQKSWQIDAVVITQKKLKSLLETRAKDRAKAMAVAQLEQPAGEAVEALAEKIRKIILPDTVAFEHFGNLVGIDRYKAVGYCAVIGRTLPPHREAELIAEVLHGAIIDEYTAGQSYENVKKAIRIRGEDRGPIVEVLRHKDPLAEAVRYEICEGGGVQAIGRARAPNRGPNNPCHIDVICNLALPIEVDEVAEWGDVQKEAVGLLFAAMKGAQIGEGKNPAAWASGLYPEQWAKPDNYNTWAKRGGDETSAEKTGMRPRPQTVFPTYATFTAKVAKKGSARQDIHLDLASNMDPRKLLETARGEPVAIEIKHLPIRDAWNRLHSGLGVETFRDLALSYTNMVALSHEMDFALAAEIQNDPAMMIPPAPDMPSYDELGGYFPITQRTATGWNTWLFFPKVNRWFDIDMNPATPPDKVREAGVAKARKVKLS